MNSAFKSLRTHSALEQIINTGRMVDPVKWTVADALAKLLEEGGELSQAAQTKMGKLAKDLPPNADFDEGADALMCVIDIVSQANLDKTPDEIISELVSSVYKKLPKWKEKMEKAGTVRTKPQPLHENDRW